MNHFKSLAPLYAFTDRKFSVLASVAVVGLGSVLLTLLAQITIPLPWTPIPITGQTFGVTLVALTFGRKHAMGSVLLYLALGMTGLPVFALGKTALTLGATTGYLVGMVASTYIIGGLSDRGWLKTWRTALAAGFIGSAIVFTCGLTVLSFFIPTESLLIAGLIPFLPGDLIKTTLAVSLARAADRHFT